MICTMRRPPYLFSSSLSIPRCLLFPVFVFLCAVPGILSSREVALGSIEIFNTHEWLPTKPIVYFHCVGENMTILPDVKKTNTLYTFKGEESWQPLTDLPEQKCKRCGIYEQDTFKKDDVYDEWELCSSDFIDGKCTRYKEGEFNATFVCVDCTASNGDSVPNPFSEVVAKKTPLIIVILVSILASVLVIVGLFGTYQYWLKKKRERDQARFLKLFEEGDDLEDELGLGNVV